MAAAELEVHVDKQGRICDAVGRPLRDRQRRDYGKAPFKGKGGTPKVSDRLAARIKAYEERSKDNGGRKRPGSNTK